MFKEFLMRKMLKSQLAGMSQEQQEQIIAMVERNPELFQNIAKEMQVKMKEGKSQMAAAMEVMQAHRGDIEQALL